MTEHVYVVVADYGLNGAEVIQVRRTRPDEETLQRLAQTPRPGGLFPPASATGFSGLDVTEHEMKP